MRVTRSSILVLLAILIAVLTTVPGPSVRAESDLPDSGPSTTINEFFPESENLTDCLGALERPGCGSEGRGGWRQSVLFAVMVGGLVVVFGRIAYSVRRAQRTRP